MNKELIYGKNAVIEALRAGRTPFEIYLLPSIKDTPFEKEIREFNFPIEFIKQSEFEKILNKQISSFENKLGKISHGGVFAFFKEYNYYELNDILKEETGPLFFVILDEITDPHNLGGIIRTAEAAGVTAIIIPKHGSACVTPTVYKTSAGAASYIKICRETNLNSAIKLLKQYGIWVYGAENSHSSKNYLDIDYGNKIALVIGSEGKGIKKLIKQNCDFLVSIPMNGKVNSLNASVAAGILIYEVKKYIL